MKDVQKVTFGGMITALVTVMMLFEGFLSIGGAYLVPGIAGIIILFMTYATGLKWGVYTYISSSAVSFMLCMDKEAALCFVLLLGYYPMLRYVFEKIKNPILKIVVKLIFFNITAAVIFLTATFLLAVPLEKIEIFGRKRGCFSNVSLEKQHSVHMERDDKTDQIVAALRSKKRRWFTKTDEFM